ncbi:MAG TPA: macro domain-containing protein [Candidatus Babeliales bacterium]|nr:macro domain-containing protein [Candidatus Babeliales bacterium]
MEYIKSWALSLITALGFIQPAIVQPIIQQSYIIGNTRITLVQGDITEQTVDAIVNAANEKLQHDGGVARAISNASGKNLQEYCNSLPIISDGQRCPMGKAVITPAFNLEKIGIKKIIHTTGPRGNTPNKEQLLRDAYKNSLLIAQKNNLNSIAFPAISTAIFGYDSNQATPIALKTIHDFVKEYPNTFKEIRFVVFSNEDLVIYKKYMQVYIR